MAEAFIVRRGGGGSGGTLVVTSSGAGTVTVSNSTLDKSYSKTVTAGGSVTFKGLKTGDWTVTLSNGTQTTTQTVEINADYSVSVSYFSATINVTYPEGSTCICSDGITTLTAPDTTGTWACIVPNSGTWTVKCYDGADYDSSDKKKSADVEITTDGQSESVTLTYELVLFDGGDIIALTGGWAGDGHSYSNSCLTNNTRVGIKWTGEFDSSNSGKTWCAYTKNAVDFSGYSVLKANITSVSGYKAGLAVGTPSGYNTSIPSFTAQTNMTSAGIVSVSLDGLSSGKVSLYTTQQGGYASVNRYIYADKIWLE